MRGRVQFYAICGLGWDWMGWMVIIGHRSSKSAFGANNRIDDHIKTSTSARVVGEAG